MSKASKKRPRDDVPCVPIGSPVWIVKSWRELPENRHAARDHVSYTDHCVDGVFANVEAANAEARKARDRLVAKYELSEEEDEGQEEDEEGEGTDEEVNDEEPFVYYRDLEAEDDYDEDEVETGTLHVEVEKLYVGEAL